MRQSDEIVELSRCHLPPAYDEIFQLDEGRHVRRHVFSGTAPIEMDSALSIQLSHAVMPQQAEEPSSKTGIETVLAHEAVDLLDDPGVESFHRLGRGGIGSVRRVIDLFEKDPPARLDAVYELGQHGLPFRHVYEYVASMHEVEGLARSFLDGVAAKGRYLTRGLRRVARRHKGAVVDVRGLGLMLGVEFRGEAGPVVKGLRERGILAVKAGANVLRLLPPLVVKRSEIKALLDALDAVLEGGAGAAA